MSSTSPRTSRTLGALLGVHTGDSLGATLEFSSWHEIFREHPTGLRDIVGGGPFNWLPGHATDDTDLTRAVLLAYADYEDVKKAGNAGAVDKYDIAKAAAEYSLAWNEGEWPGRKRGRGPIDIGNATRIALQQYKSSRNPATSGAGRGSAGNGSLMRCIPSGLFAAPDSRVQESMRISAFTHNDRRCTVACAAYNEIVAALVEGKTPQQAVHLGKSAARDLNAPNVADAIENGETLALAKIASEGPKDGDVNASGYVLSSLTLAIAAVLDVRSFEDVLVDVVRIGGDTDTNAAIAGGLLGARDGIEGIPERWLEKLQFREEFEEVVMKILQLQQGGK